MEDKRSWLLAVELAGPQGLLALEGPGGLFHNSWEGGERSKRLFVAAGELLRRAGIGPHDLGLVGVGKGPGSFTGIRMGVMAAKALAEVLGIPLVAPDSLAAVAVGPEGAERVAVALDARRGELYVALFMMEGNGVFGFPQRLEGPLVCAPEETARLLREWTSGLAGELLLVGSGVDAYPDIWPPEARRAERRGPDPAGFVWLCRQLHMRGELEDHLSLKPLYLRRPEVGKVSYA
ncbi:tRNA (adenosine(37)-N6)-threonylcarbamoyltransferase complex dimerization subunit type 1 TsaB [Candidatus Solincola tengchongensis]|uniref:tRNA (adenosine(37)-N6)-threonylcarbamoyltransferase complex dimerization subunit type 1 TsaB n=1 Tax=Candidatus Solincola tengchongensis TaxID=2900693 RepID=UPI002580C1A5|nr:tRNA (adenosine(37)-N6)-threonylcarbamoyltransferase complex dimerization subunit type 1 TsaB [Candidatus Solincola tengchongensis]